MKKILITGANSYIGNSFESWISEDENYVVEEVSTQGNEWKAKDFSEYDVVFHVAGIAHVSSNPKMRDLYYKVNRDLAIQVAEKAKKEQIKQFIFMSSIIVYGDNKNSNITIDLTTSPKPSNFYGDSKLQAEKGLRQLETSTFKVAILRPPMIYGRNSKGNYPKLSNLAKRTPIFPNFENRRSMLHIDNLCEFIKILINNNESGIYFPQNSEYVNTTDLVKLIGKYNNNKIRTTKLFNPLLKLMMNINIVNKVFGNLVYDQSISQYDKGNYQIRTLEESIKRTELENYV